MASQETNIFNEIRIAVSAMGARLFRNHTGMVKDERGRVHRFGLCKGSSDGIGWVSVVITPEMVGKQLAVFTAIEAKTPTGRASKEQKNFIEQVSNAGGIAGIARSGIDSTKLIDDYLKKLLDI